MRIDQFDVWCVTLTSCPGDTVWSHCRDSISAATIAPSRHSSKLLNPFTCSGYCPNCSMVDRILPAFIEKHFFSKTSRQHISSIMKCYFSLTLMNSLSYKCPIEKLNHWVVLFVFWITGESERPYISFCYLKWNDKNKLGFIFHF